MPGQHQYVRLPFFVLSSTLAKKKDPQGKDERSKACVSFRCGVSFLNKVGFKTQTVGASESLTLSVHVTSKHSAQPGLPWPGIDVALVGLPLQN